MIKVDIPDFGRLELENLVLDYNGTLALDGAVLPGVAELLQELAEELEIHVLTADTFGTCKQALEGLPVKVSVLGRSPEDEAKLDYVEELGVDSCVCIGNGRNDRLMLQSAALGMVVLEAEGTALDAFGAGDIVIRDIVSALQLLLKPVRLKATLRT